MQCGYQLLEVYTVAIFKVKMVTNGNNLQDHTFSESTRPLMKPISEFYLRMAKLSVRM